MDLNRAAAALEPHRQGWLAAGLRASPVLWGEEGEELAVRVSGSAWQVDLYVGLQATGRAHLVFVSPAHTAEELRRVRSVEAWESLLDEAVIRAPRTSLQPAQLLAESCTTSWLDWIHGELWLLPDALVRIRSSLIASLGHSRATARSPYRHVLYDPTAILATHRTNKVIPLAYIAEARLHGGVTTSGMTLRMTDGTHHKLLWLSTEPARRLLRDRLLPALGPRLTH
ncbi:hypothetical protein ABTY98_24480 [Streptomyces sp. NPDC096040]|uniref:hypothetical protein n=1 Tax=Streptomyces sp. NPDC096040 TaxID=3155541 RepID=UPI00331A70E2